VSILEAPAIPSALADGTGDIAQELLRLAGNRFATILADPAWRFINKSGKVSPGHQRLYRYRTMTIAEICALPVERVAAPMAHLYLWCPNALLPAGLAVMQAWGFEHKTNLVWRKIRKDGGSDGRGVGFYFRNVTELILFGVRGKNARTLAPGRTQVNFLETRKREHSRKPDELYPIIEACSPGPYLELFARAQDQSEIFPCRRRPWVRLGDEADDEATLDIIQQQELAAHDPGEPDCGAAS
jgi:N6-adenosine-specific RNA methylase IME4